MDLDPAEVRVLGCLIEKQITTPEQYPLTVNALMNACNQSTNRFPVVSYDEQVVTNALTQLRGRGLTRIVYSPSNRAPKHRHVADERWELRPEELALVCVLLLRGPQTPGELKGRTERMHGFASTEEVERVLDTLARLPEPFTVRLERQPGQKEARWMHLVGGPVDEAAYATLDTTPVRAAVGPRPQWEGRVDTLETELGQLRELVRALREHAERQDAELATLRSSLEELRRDLGA